MVTFVGGTAEDFRQEMTSYLDLAKQDFKHTKDRTDFQIFT